MAGPLRTMPGCMRETGMVRIWLLMSAARSAPSQSGSGE
ncbi:unnamed protein product [Chondrus crispus]|uniref:Uncharacterized protein n=1 Tax=Chondrus crispus TaxID=2769 RepID=R7QJ49_CHOCR|nr:unnamed protein product [Chondrus crispus]CDF38527.1 unnamed protein product [Chondrus crispus]|eukprot:XP_005718420.1 unnamed protein product [Chondrus crispus]